MSEYDERLARIVTKLDHLSERILDLVSDNRDRSVNCKVHGETIADHSRAIKNIERDRVEVRKQRDEDNKSLRIDLDKALELAERNTRAIEALQYWTKGAAWVVGVAWVVLTTLVGFYIALK